MEWDSNQKKVLTIGGGVVVAGLLVGAAYYLFSKSNESRPKEYQYTALSQLTSTLQEIEREFIYPIKKIEEIRDNILREMREGLEPNSHSSLKMIPTYVTHLPTGREVGTAYAVDIGGSNLRVLKVDLDGKGNAIPDSKLHDKWQIPEIVMQSNAEHLFGSIAEHVHKVIFDTPQPIGFTFSFPVKQVHISSGLLIKWTKGFTAEGVVNKDVVYLLNEACMKRNVPATVNALINDTVGTLLAGAYHSINSDCCMGVILGTGSNACYVERVKNIKKFTDNTNAEYMIINMESGNFGSRLGLIGSDLPMNKWDKTLNNESTYKDNQLLEKQISGMYLGEIFRIIMVDLITSKKIFPALAGNIIGFKNPFPTSEMSEIELDRSPTLEEVSQKLKARGISDSTLDERKFVKAVCQLVAKRGAMLAAAQIAACLRQMNKENHDVVIAIDGSVFEKYPGFPKIMDETLETLLHHRRVRLVLTHDGSGVGAALASYMHRLGGKAI